MIDEKWTLLFGLPIIALLSVMVWRRAQAVTRRIREEREEMTRNPQNPYLALALLVEEKKAKPARRRTRTGGGDG